MAALSLKAQNAFRIYRVLKKYNNIHWFGVGVTQVTRATDLNGFSKHGLHEVPPSP
jgi:hypothetical protein